MGKLPKAIRESEIEIMGIKLKCCVLDNGQRVFEAESFRKFWEAFSSPGSGFTEEDAKRVAAFSKGVEYIPPPEKAK